MKTFLENASCLWKGNPDESKRIDTPTVCYYFWLCRFHLTLFIKNQIVYNI